MELHHRWMCSQTSLCAHAHPFLSICVTGWIDGLHTLLDHSQFASSTMSQTSFFYSVKGLPWCTFMLFPCAVWQATLHWNSPVRVGGGWDTSTTVFGIVPPLHLEEQSAHNNLFLYETEVYILLYLDIFEFYIPEIAMNFPEKKWENHNF